MVTVAVPVAFDWSVTVRVNTSTALAASWMGAVKDAASVLALVRSTVGEPEVCCQE